MYKICGNSNQNRKKTNQEEEQMNEKKQHLIEPR